MIKFRQQLFLSSVIVTLLLCFFITITGIFVYKHSFQKDLSFADSILNHYTEKANILSTKMLTSYTKKYLNVRTLNLKYKIISIFKNDLQSDQSLNKDPKLQKLISQPLFVNNKEVGYFALLKGVNKLVYAPPKILAISKTLSSSDKFPKLSKLKQKALEKGHSSGYIKFYNQAGAKIVNKYAVFEKLNNTNYLVAGLINIDGYHLAAEQHIHKLKNEYLKQEKNKLNEYYMSSTYHKSFYFIIAILIILLIYILIISNLVKSITKPLNILIDKIRNFDSKKPDFNIVLPENASQEIIELADAFSTQEHELISYMHNFKHELENRHIVEHELQVARKIQSAVLPKNSLKFSPSEFSLASRLISAESVAGDFYDYFFINENKLAILIADVSGKGIPAAFFMQRATTILHTLSILEKGNNPDKVLEKTNAALAKDNDACMFVAVFLAFYDIKTGIMTYANGGHSKPFKISKGKVTSFGHLNNLALGVKPDENYQSQTIDIHPDETVVFYTIGILDAISMENEEYGRVRFKNLLVENEKLSVHDLCDEVINDICAFHAGQKQDDLTLLIFRRYK